MPKNNKKPSTASTLEKRKETKFIIRPMQVACCFFLITQKGWWLGPPLKIPQKVLRLQRNPCFHMCEKTLASQLFD